MITVISNYANDEIIYEDTNEKKIMHRGPAYYITKVLDSLKSDYNIFCGKDPVNVTIKVTGESEKGTIHDVVPIEVGVVKEIILISTLLDEFDLLQLNTSKYENKLVCLDIQGYTRIIEDEHKKHPEVLSQVAGRIGILKGTVEELSVISKEVIDKIDIVISTMGHEGCMIKQKDKIFKFKPPHIHAEDAIGAGDTFFTAFVSKYAKTKDIEQAGKFATDYVVEFLRAKNEK